MDDAGEVPRSGEERDGPARFADRTLIGRVGFASWRAEDGWRVGFASWRAEDGWRLSGEEKSPSSRSC